MSFLMIDGLGDPDNSQDFKNAIDALYAVASTLKFQSKIGEAQIDYPVMPLESLWTTSDQPCFDADTNKALWRWTLMIMQPEFIGQAQVEAALRKASHKVDQQALSCIRLERYDEGLAVQIMHIGPLETEGPTIDRLHAYLRANRHRCRARLHKAHLSDIRRTSPARLKTVIRQPIEPGSR